MQLLIAALTFIFSSSYVLFLDHLLLSPRVLQKVLVIPIIIIGFALYRAAKQSSQIFNTTYDKWLFLFGGTVFIQLLVLATGGFQSPFLILIHLFMICISFFLSFSISVIFLLFCFIVILADMSFYHGVIQLLLKNPSTILLQVVSLLSIIPLAYIISQQYHAKDILSRLLTKKVATTESIFNTVNEMIIVTNAELEILSVNAAAVHILQQSRSELVNTPLFNVLFLKDQAGKLVTKQTLFPDGRIPTSSKEKTFFLMKSHLPQSAITMRVQLIKTPEEKSTQVSFIISSPHTSVDTIAATLDKARGKYEALIQEIKTKLQANNTVEVQTDIALLEKIESDTYMLQSLQNYTPKDPMPRIDIAQLCKKLLLSNHSFANSLHVGTDFALHNFGMKDIAPLTVKNYPVKPEQLTGPFFTTACDVQQIEYAVKKLLDLGIFLASSEKDPNVILSVQRTKSTISIIVTASCPVLTEKELHELFSPYYNTLTDKTNVYIGSGLEGFLAKRITDMLGLSLHVSYVKEAPKHITFTMRIPKTLEG